MSIVINFDEILLDPGFFQLEAATGGPEYQNVNLRNPQTGVPSVAVLRYDPFLIWQVDFADIKYPDAEGLEYFNNIWMGGEGSAYGLRVRNQWDYFTEGEVLGTTDGLTNDFKLTKKYQRPGTTSHPYFRRIVKPVVNQNNTSGITLYESNGTTTRVLGSPSFDVDFKVFLDDIDQGTLGWTVNNTTGVLTLTPKNFTADSSTNALTIANHHYPSGAALRVGNTGGALPAPLAINTTYYVRDITTNTFKLSATVGGAAIDLTTNGTGVNSVTAPPSGIVVAVDMQFDVPMQFWVNMPSMKADFPAEAKGLAMVEIPPIALGIE